MLELHADVMVAGGRRYKVLLLFVCSCVRERRTCAEAEWEWMEGRGEEGIGVGNGLSRRKCFWRSSCVFCSGSDM